MNDLSYFLIAALVLLLACGEEVASNKIERLEHTIANSPCANMVCDGQGRCLDKHGRVVK